MPDESEPKRDAGKAVEFFNACIAIGLTRAEARELTVAYVLGGLVREDEPKREPWESDRG